MILTYLGANLTPSTTSLCGAYSVGCLGSLYCIGPTLGWNVGFPEDTLVATPEAVASVHSSNLPLDAVRYNLIVTNPLCTDSSRCERTSVEAVVLFQHCKYGGVVVFIPNPFVEYF